MPIYQRLWKAAGFIEKPVDFSGVTYQSMRRMAGNSFNQACATTFVMYVLSKMVKRED